MGFSARRLTGTRAGPASPSAAALKKMPRRLDLSSFRVYGYGRAAAYDLDRMPCGGTWVPDSDELRKLAAWYREFAERTDNPAIWDARLRTAEKLEADADRVASKPPSERWKDSS